MIVPCNDPALSLSDSQHSCSNVPWGKWEEGEGASCPTPALKLPFRVSQNLLEGFTSEGCTIPLFKGELDATCCWIYKAAFGFIPQFYFSPPTHGLKLKLILFGHVSVGFSFTRLRSTSWITSLPSCRSICHVSQLFVHGCLWPHSTFAAHMRSFYMLRLHQILLLCHVPLIKKKPCAKSLPCTLKYNNIMHLMQNNPAEPGSVPV